MRRSFALIPLLFLLSIAIPSAQLRTQPIAERPDDVALQLMLRKLASTGTFMETTAHPDDEDNSLLAMLSHGEGMRTVLVTATRGDGGQNEIGPELFQALGVLRTEELLAVHRFDETEQFFTRAVDFGYSFSIEESIQKWGHDEILGDFVRHIRTIRPDVIAGFLCGGEGGGQHHQASARLTVEAFRAAADPAKYPEQLREGLRPWQARRVFCTEGFFGPGGQQRPTTPDLVTVDTSGFDRLLGMTYSEVGLEARSMHKCQGTSQLLALPGQTFNRTYRLKDSVIGQPGIAPARLFDGVDTTLAGLAAYAGPRPPADLTEALRAISAGVDLASKALASGGPSAAAAPLVQGLAAVRALRGRLPSLNLSDLARYEIDFRLAQKEAQFEQAVVLAYGMRFEALTDDGVVMRGEPLKLSFAVGNHGPDDVTLSGVDVAGLAEGRASCTGTVKKGGAVTCTGTGTVPASAGITGPYWTPRQDAARYDFEPDVPFGVPFRPSPFRVTFHVKLGSAAVDVERVLQYRYSDIFAGEKRMELSVAPAFSVRLMPSIVVVPRGTAGSGNTSVDGPSSGSPSGATRDVQVVVINQHKGPAEGTVRLAVPQGWTVNPAQLPVKFSREDEEITRRFSLAPPSGVAPGRYEASALVEDAAGRYDTGYDVVEYPHIHRRQVPEAARAQIDVLDVKVPAGLRVGYVMGVGDQVPEAIAQLGAHVELITPEQLASGDLSVYNAIVTGVRAYERRPDLRANNHRLLAYAENGGTVLVQYNKFEFNEAQYGPYPAKVSSNRVTDENAPIEVLDPSNPVFNTPNRLGPETWAGWVQERGLYFLGDRDPRYVDLVQSTDPFPLNPGPKRGALVEAKVGKGRWIYIGLGLWRELPAGVPGAYRLMANLLSLH
jgi:LmbE family N-acetylglucosaminyl deacetylase